MYVFKAYKNVHVPNNINNMNSDNQQMVKLILMEYNVYLYHWLSDWFAHSLNERLLSQGELRREGETNIAIELCEI